MIWLMMVIPIRMLLQSANMLQRTTVRVFVICAQIEQEIAEPDDDEKQEYLDALGPQ